MKECRDRFCALANLRQVRRRTFLRVPAGSDKLAALRREDVRNVLAFVAGVMLTDADQLAGKYDITITGRGTR